jgi:hypothetical protein
MKPFKTNDFHIQKQVFDSRRFYSFLNLHKIQISPFFINSIRWIFTPQCLWPCNMRQARVTQTGHYVTQAIKQINLFLMHSLFYLIIVFRK